MNSSEWANWLGRFFPAIPLAAALGITGFVTLISGVALAWLYSRTSNREAEAVPPVRASGHGIGIGKLVSGPSASVIGSILGLVLAGSIGQFLGNPVCALGFGVAQQGYTGEQSARDWGQWRSVFVAGWIGSWVGQLSAQFAFTALPSSLRLDVVVPVVALQVPTSEVFGYLVGVGTALIVRAGGRGVAIGSDIDTAAAGTSAGLVWILILVAMALLTVPLTDLQRIVGLLLGPTSGISIAVTAWAVPVFVAALSSMLICAVALPQLVARQRHFSITISRDELNRVRSIEYRDRFGSMAGPGAFTGLLLTLVFLYAFVAGTGARVGSWIVVGSILLLGAGMGAALATVLTAKFDMLKAESEIELALGRDGTGKFDPILLTPASLQVIGELLFGAATGLSLAGTSFFIVLLLLRKVSLLGFAAGLTLGAILAVVLVAVFKRAQRSHLTPGFPIAPVPLR